MALTARLSQDGKTILAQFPYDETLVEWIRTFPGAKWDQNFRQWRITTTPAAAWRLDVECPCEAAFSPELQGIANGFAEDLEAREAIKAGRPIAQPVLYQSPSWRHQLAAYGFVMQGEAALLDMFMGTGKSKVAVDIVFNTQSKTVLILCPLSVLSVWRREFSKWAPTPYSIFILDQRTWSAQKKANQAKRFLENIALPDPKIVVVNYDTARTKEFARWACNRQWDMTIGDESHRFGSHDSLTCKFMSELGKVSHRRLCLTGTPLSTPLKAYGQFLFLDRGVFGDSWTRHRNRYAVSGFFGKNQIVSYKDQDDLAQRFGWLTYKVDQTVLDLPPITHNMRGFDMNEDAARLYDVFENELIAKIKDGIVTAKNGLVKTLRLRQTACGFTGMDDTAQIEEIDRGRELLLADLLDDIDPSEPVVVFCTWKHDLVAIRRTAEKLGRRYAELSGSRRDAIDDQAMLAEGVQVAGVQLQSGGIGVDFTRARYGFFFSIDWSMVNYDQAIARLHRPGQEKPTIFYHLFANETIDEKVYDAIDNKRDIIEYVLEYLRAKQNDQQ